MPSTADSTTGSGVSNATGVSGATSVSSDETETSDAAIFEALEVLRDGGLVAFPTETVWGLGVRADSVAAVAALRSFKQRADGNPISVLVSGRAGLEALGANLGEEASRLVADFWPGPLTLVVRCARELAPGIAAIDGTIGVRCSSHPRVARLVEAAERLGIGPLTASSLNRSGEPPAATREQATLVCAEAAARLETQDLRVLQLDGEAGGQPPSTVVDATGDEALLIREGAIPASALRARSRTHDATLETKSQP